MWRVPGLRQAPEVWEDAADLSFPIRRISFVAASIRLTTTRKLATHSTLDCQKGKPVTLLPSPASRNGIVESVQCRRA